MALQLGRRKVTATAQVTPRTHAPMPKVDTHAPSSSSPSPSPSRHVARIKEESPGSSLAPVPGWQSRLDEFIASNPPRADNLSEYIYAAAVKLGIPELDVSKYIRPLLKTGKLIAIHTVERAMHQRAAEVADLLGVRVAKAFKVYDDAMDAEKVHIDKEGNIHSTPDHRMRVEAATKILTALGANAPSKAVVEHEVGDKLEALATADLKLHLIELVMQANKTIRTIPGTIEPVPE